MTIEQAIAEIAEGSHDLIPLLRRLKLTVTRINDPDLNRQMEELVNLNGRMWTAVSTLMQTAEAELKNKEVRSKEDWRDREGAYPE